MEHDHICLRLYIKLIPRLGLTSSIGLLMSGLTVLDLFTIRYITALLFYYYMYIFKNSNKSFTWIRGSTYPQHYSVTKKWIFLLFNHTEEPMCFREIRKYSPSSCFLKKTCTYDVYFIWENNISDILPLIAFYGFIIHTI